MLLLLLAIFIKYLKIRFWLNTVNPVLGTFQVYTVLSRDLKQLKRRKKLEETII